MRDLIGLLAEALYENMTVGGGKPSWEYLDEGGRDLWRNRAWKLVDMGLNRIDKWLDIKYGGNELEDPPSAVQPTQAPEQTEGTARDRANLHLVETETWRIRPSTLEEDGVEAEGARLTTIENVREDERLRGLDAADLQELARALRCFRFLRGPA